MLRLIERSIATIEDDLVLVAPPYASVPEAFGNVSVDSQRHQLLIAQMQRLRGAIYLHEGNIRATQLTRDGRHDTPEDHWGWHILMTDGCDSVTACALYMEHPNTISAMDLRVRSCPLLADDKWGPRMLAAVEREIGRAREAGLGFSELGGWAIKPERRGTPDGLMMALATYALGRERGGALGITTANVQHACSNVLRRLGGRSLEFEGQPIPPYFDRRYNTEIELLRFDSRAPNTKYAALIDVVREKLSKVRVVASAARSLGDIGSGVPASLVAVA